MAQRRRTVTHGCHDGRLGNASACSKNNPKGMRIEQKVMYLTSGTNAVTAPPVLHVLRHEIQVLAVKHESS